MKLFFPERTIHADGWYRVMQPPAISGLTSHRRNIWLCITRSPPSVSHKSAFWFIFPPTPFYHIHHPSSIGIFHNKLVHNLCITTIYSTDNANFSPPKKTPSSRRKRRTGAPKITQTTAKPILSLVFVEKYYCFWINDVLYWIIIIHINKLFGRRQI